MPKRFSGLFFLFSVSLVLSPALAASSEAVTLISGYRIVHTDPVEFISALRTSTPPSPIATADAKSSNAREKFTRLNSIFEIRRRTLSGGSIYIEVIPNIQRLGTDAIDGLATSVNFTQMTQDKSGFHYVMQIKIPSGYTFSGSMDVEKHKSGSLIACHVTRPNAGLLPVKLIAESVMSVLGLAGSIESAEKAESRRESAHD